VDSANKRIAAAVDDAKASYPTVNMQYVSVYDYLPVGACSTGSEEQYVQGVRYMQILGLSVSSFHPTQLGYDAYYTALVDSL
jgi:lysophospholipase L1-like esterase